MKKMKIGLIRNNHAFVKIGGEKQLFALQNLRGKKKKGKKKRACN